MSGKTGNEQLKFAEFVALTAMMMSLVALSIDAMLPALTVIGGELGVLHENSNQLIISLLFLGMSAGQIIYGPLSLPAENLQSTRGLVFSSQGHSFPSLRQVSP